MNRHLLYCAAAALTMAACSSNEIEENTVEHPRNAVAIRIGQTVEGVTARAAVENGSSVTATVLTANYSSNYDATTAWNSFTPQLTNELTEGGSPTLETPANVSTATFTAGENQAVALNPTLYYYSTNGTAVVAVAPAGNVNGENVVMRLADGEQDVMYAEAKTVDAKPDNQDAADNTPVALTFAHKTTQLNFAFKKTPVPGSSWSGKSVSVKSIAIQNADLPESVRFSNGTVNWKPVGNLEVPGITVGNSVTEDAAKVGHSVMVNTSNDIRLDIVLTVGGTDYAFTDVPVMGANPDEKLSTVIGSSHLITLTVNEPVSPSGGVEITTTATVTAWTTGEAGSGTLN